MKKKYIDYAGLKRVLKHLLPPIDAKPTCHGVDGNMVKGQKIVELTKAQFDALSTKDPDTYYMINDDNKAKPWYPHPDWAKYITISVADLITTEYKAPADGMIVGTLFAKGNSSPIVILNVNGIEVVRGGGAKDSSRIFGVQCVVGKGDVIAIFGGDEATINSGIRFVPWKA